jgi:hypothetical protein
VRCVFDAIEAEGPPVVSGQVVSDQVPAAVEGDQAVRLDVTVGSLAAGRGVGEAEAFGVPARQGGAGEDVRVDGRLLAGAFPGGGLGHRGHRFGPAAQPGRHDLGDLRECAGRRLRYGTGRGLGRRVDGSLCGQPQSDSQGDRFLVVDDERRQGRARGQLVAAVNARVRRDGVAEVAEPADVTAQRARGDAQPLGELRARPEPVILQQGEQTQGAGAGVRHVLILSHIADRNWPQCPLG